MSDNGKEPDLGKLDFTDPAIRQQTEAAILAVCTYVARQLKAGKSQAAIRDDLLKEGLPASAVAKIMASVSSHPEAFLRMPRRALRSRLRGLIVALLWLIVGILMLGLSSQGIARGMETALRVIGWIAVIIGALSLAWSGLVVYLSRRR